MKLDAKRTLPAAIAFALAGLLSALGAAWAVADTMETRDRYSGRVVGIFQTTTQSECTDSDGNRRTCYSPIISYTVDGQRYEHHGPARLSWDLGGYHARVPLRYDPAAPADAIIEGEEDFHPLAVACPCFTCSFWGLALLAAFATFRARRSS